MPDIALMIAAPSSGRQTTVTLALLSAFRARPNPVGFKWGLIDPMFHRPCSASRYNRLSALAIRSAGFSTSMFHRAAVAEGVVHDGSGTDGGQQLRHRPRDRTPVILVNRRRHIFIPSCGNNGFRIRKDSRIAGVT